jgi:poly-gamma-glutamate capsule biosynthesis protein CapA/YwtB (metallophosphatase superfamily)
VETVRIILGGDVMLGRLVGQQFRRFGPGYPLGRIAQMMKQADMTLINLECAITTSQQRWPGRPKAFYFGAPPEAVLSLGGAGVDLVSLANNHILDYGEEGLGDTLRLLQEQKIGFAGAGRNLREARRPSLRERKGIRFGMVAYCDHQEDFSAEEDRTGMAYLDLRDRGEALIQMRKSLDQMKEANVDWPILSLHWGPNSVHRPSAEFVEIAHAAIDLGYTILFGHSAHIFHGVEIYRGRPIFYSAGDLVDDYYVDPELKNDHQLLFEIETKGGALQRIRFHPVFIMNCQTQHANPEQSEYIASRIVRLSAEMGTEVQQKDGQIWIDCQ